MQIANILSQIDLGAMALPEFQRGCVWNRDQVRELMTSLYRRYPVGGLLVWTTKTDQASARGNASLQPGFVDLLLDGQQRMTSLYGVIRGELPQFFQGNKDAFLNLYFNMESETFKFYAPLEMKGSPYWVNVTDLMGRGVGPYMAQLVSVVTDPQQLSDAISRLSNVHGIQNIDLHIDKVAGPDKTIDVVVDIFNKVNSGGTKLSKGDLALAKICAEWPDARKEMQQRLSYWHSAGFGFDLDWLLRNITTVRTGQAMFAGLADISASDFQTGLKEAEKACNIILNLVSARLGLDHDRILGSRYAFPVMTRYLVQQGGTLSDITETNKLLYWYIHTFLWGRFAGSTETVMNVDLKAVATPHANLDQLISQLQQWRGDLRVRAGDFAGNSMGARFYPMLYMLTRVYKARDWDNGGLELNAQMLGKLNWLQVHHIFPKAQLYKHGYGRGEVNAIANYCFLTQQTNLAISDKRPEVYFADIEKNYPGALASQWIPMDRELWKVENYHEFLAARRELLAAAANRFLDSLNTNVASTNPVSDPAMERNTSTPAPLGSSDDAEMQQIELCNTWVVEQGLPAGKILHELVDDAGQQVASIDLAWPDGMQLMKSGPVGLLLNEGAEIETIVNNAGYRFFTSFDALQTYGEQEVLGRTA